MKNVARIKWLSSFDMEPLVSAILQNGMLIGAGLIAASVVIERMEPAGTGHVLQAFSIPTLILADLQRYGTPHFWSRLLLDTGIAVLMVTPFLQLCVSMLYFTFVDLNWKCALCTGIILVVLTIVLFSRLV